MRIDDLLRALAQAQGSDLHLKLGQPPAFRIHGELRRANAEPLTREALRAHLESLASASQLERFELEMELDFSYGLEGVGRFRVNALRQKGEIGLVIRAVASAVPSLDSLGLPPILKELALRPQGLFLVTGPTGSGKSTTLAALVDHINAERAVHIVTVEDPIEFVHTDKRALINQREIGLDTRSFAEALRRALRQDPDVILIGEMRDPDTIGTAITAAETGHLVLSTLHTNDAAQTIDRIIDTYPAGERSQVRLALAATLLAVVSQRLVPRASAKGRVAVQEILIGTPLIAKLIETGETSKIPRAIQEGQALHQMQTLNQCLAERVRDGSISSKDALAVSLNPADLKLLLHTTGVHEAAVFKNALDAAKATDAAGPGPRAR